MTIIRDFPKGRFYRLDDGDTKTIVGRFMAEQLEPASARQYVSKLPQDVQQQAMDLLTGGRVKL